MFTGPKKWELGTAPGLQLTCFFGKCHYKYNRMSCIGVKIYNLWPYLLCRFISYGHLYMLVLKLFVKQNQAVVIKM